MNVSELLDRIFNNRYLKGIMPSANSLITLFRSKTWIVTRFDRKSGKYIYYQNKYIIYVDDKFNWNIYYSRFFDTLKSIICCNYLPQKGDIVVDLGAGVGTETIVFQR